MQTETHMDKHFAEIVADETYPKSYWLDVPLILGETTNLPKQTSIAVVGSGLSGVSAAYFLQKQGFDDVTILDFKAEQAASYRNAGHILYGTVESMKALSEIHGESKARDLWQFSIDICTDVRESMREHGIAADYRQDGYLVIADSEVEDGECKESVELLNRNGFASEYWSPEKVKNLGFKNCFGARYEPGSAQAHPVKFRNGLLEVFLKNGGHYYSDVKVLNVDADSQGAVVDTDRGEIKAEAVVIAANAYSPLFSNFFQSRNLVDPFRGNIITSKPLKHDFKVKFPHSFDHGYEYALVTEDNRLLIGGWRQNSESREMGTYSLEINQYIENGLKDFARDHYEIEGEFEWEYSWAGIMAASKTGLPFIGATNSDRIFACSGYTGHGFSWAHGSAKLLADIIVGNETPEVAKYFNPKLLS